MKLLHKNELKTLKPTGALYGEDLYTELDNKTKEFIKGVLTLALERARQEGRSTIRSQDINAGYEDFLQSQGLTYLKQLKEVMLSETQKYFELKINEVEKWKSKTL